MNEFPLNINSTHARSHNSPANVSAVATADGTDFNSLLAQQIMDADTPTVLPETAIFGKTLAQDGNSPRKQGKGGLQIQDEIPSPINDGSTSPNMLAALLGQTDISSGMKSLPAMEQNLGKTALEQPSLPSAKSAHKLDAAKNTRSRSQDATKAELDPAELALGAGAAGASGSMTGLPAVPANSTETGTQVSRKGAMAVDKNHLAHANGKGSKNHGKTDGSIRDIALPGFNVNMTEEQKGALADKSTQTRPASRDISALLEKETSLQQDSGNLKAGDLHESAATAAATLAASEQKNQPLQGHASSPQASPPPATYTMQHPVGNPAWSGEFGQQISWMTRNKEQTAELHLNPPQLGPLDVMLKVQGDQATAMFTSQHAAVREAVEQAIPRLREMLADSGIMLGNATVSDQPPQRNPDHQPVRGSSRRSDRLEAASEGVVVHEAQVAAKPRRHDGLVDTFV